MKTRVIKQHYSMSPVLLKYCMIFERQKEKGTAEDEMMR